MFLRLCGTICFFARLSEDFRAGFVLASYCSYWPRPSRRQQSKRSFEKFHVYVFRTGFVLSVLASAALVLAEAARNNFDFEKLFILASHTASSMKQNPLV